MMVMTYQEDNNRARWRHMPALSMTRFRKLGVEGGCVQNIGIHRANAWDIYSR